MPKDRVITLAGQDYALNYNFYERWYAEQQLKKGLQEAMTDGTIDSTVAILWAGIHRDQCKRRVDRKQHSGCEFTMDDMFDLLEAHHKGGGQYDNAVREALRAMYEAGVFGKTLDQKTLTRILGPEEESAGKAQAVVAQ